MTDFPALRAEWEAALGGRRAAMRDALGFWTPILDGWAAWSGGALPPLGWSAEECRERWERGVALLAEAPPSIPREALEDLLGPAMERLALAAPRAVDGLRRFAAGWDAGQIGPEDLFPGDGKQGVGLLQDRLDIEPAIAGFLAHAGLRPVLEEYFEGARPLPDGIWSPGACPWCGGLPGYGDYGEDGRRRLSCHLCGGSWFAPRLGCPFCENQQSRDLVRLAGEEMMEEGYFIEACRACHGYLKGVDRRQRWDAGSPLVEDWGSPHLDVYARREGYWRGTPSLPQLLSLDSAS